MFGRGLRKFSTSFSREFLEAPTVIDNLQKSGLKNWHHDFYHSVPSIVVTYKFKDFNSAISFINEMAAVAEKYDHHPTLINTYDTVKIVFNTHTCNGVSDLDIGVASILQNIYSKKYME